MRIFGWIIIKEKVLQAVELKYENIKFDLLHYKLRQKVEELGGISFENMFPIMKEICKTEEEVDEAGKFLQAMIMMTTGNFTSGKITIYGVDK